MSATAALPTDTDIAYGIHIREEEEEEARRLEERERRREHAVLAATCRMIAAVQCRAARTRG